MDDARAILRAAPVVPVLTITAIEQALPLAEALIAGGVRVLEVTLRTPAGLPAIRRIRDALPQAIVGAGTIINADAYRMAIDAGSRFIVTPGLTDTLLLAAKDREVPLIPGVATVSEMMRALEHGLDCLKFFPAEASGGAATLKAFGGPFPQVAFCPTGGVGLHNLAAYLALPSVLTVGGTWLTPAALVEAGDWAAIQELARHACERVAQIRSGND